MLFRALKPSSLFSDSRWSRRRARSGFRGSNLISRTPSSVSMSWCLVPQAGSLVGHTPPGDSRAAAALSLLSSV